MDKSGRMITRISRGLSALSVVTAIILLFVGVNSNPCYALPFEIQWEKTAGGAGADGGRGIATDSSGNVYVAGYTMSYGAGDSDAWILKYDPSGTLLWNRTAGGAGADIGYGIATDSSGNVYVSGYKDSYGAGSYDAWILKYNPSGTLLWSKTAGGTNSDFGRGIATDSSGNVYVAGYTASYGAGGYDAWILKYDPSGNLLWSKTAGGADADIGYGITTDSSGNVYVSGYIGSGAGGSDIWVLKYDSSGTLLWSRTAGGADADDGRGIATDSSGNVYVSGYTDSYGAGSYDAWILKYNPSGNLLWNKTAGRTNGDYGYDIATDSSGNVYVSGYTESYGAGGSDVWILKLCSCTDSDDGLDYAVKGTVTNGQGSWDDFCAGSTLLQEMSCGPACQPLTNAYNCPSGQGCSNGACITCETDAAFCSRLGKNCGNLTAIDNCGILRNVTNCGTCPSGRVCNMTGQCCLSETNTAFCSRFGKSCGNLTAIDNCGFLRTVTSCGTCLTGRVCNMTGQCCLSETNTAFCSRFGKSCGNLTAIDNCGILRNVTSCGTCGTGDVCSSAGQCCAPENNTAFCSRLGKNCGNLTAIDNCGILRNVTSCETCGTGDVCSSAGQCCAPENNTAFCSRLGKNCGNVTTGDNCGVSRTVSCGRCLAGQACNATGHCCLHEEDAAFCLRLGKNCGNLTATDGCGVLRNVTSCGTCGTGGVCSSAGQCCVREADAAFCIRLGKNCGSAAANDNCGTSRTVANCGACLAGKACNSAGQCVNSGPCGDNPPEEICDGIDNDCDGETDELTSCCEPGDERPCGSGIGACSPGSRPCRNYMWSDDCLGYTGPIEEACANLLDDDCDGETDEGDCLGASDALCAGGPIDSACRCGNSTYSTGFCCGDSYSDSPCQSGIPGLPLSPWNMVFISGLVVIVVIALMDIYVRLRKGKSGLDDTDDDTGPGQAPPAPPF